MGGEISDKERIAELADAFNKVCDENAAFVAESIKADRRIAELEARLKHCEGHAAELEAENARLKAALDRYSEDEILLIERCAKVCESVYESYERPCDTWPEARPDALSGAEDCIRAIRALKEGK